MSDQVSSEELLACLGMAQDGNVRSRSSLFAEFIVKSIAAQRLKVPSSELQIDRHAQGKPYLVGVEGFHFNVSHSGDRVLVGIADAEIGLDIEVERPLNERLISRCLSKAEISRLSSEPDIRMREFIKLWTKKEAYLKYRSCGVIQNLSKFEVDIPEIAAHMSSFEKDGAYLSVFCEEIDPRTFSFIELTDSEILSLIGVK